MSRAVPGAGQCVEADARLVEHLELLVDCPSEELRDALIESGMEGGVQEGFDLLEEVAIAAV